MAAGEVNSNSPASPFFKGGSGTAKKFLSLKKEGLGEIFEPNDAVNF